MTAPTTELPAALAAPAVRADAQPRVGLAMGGVGALGEELLAALVASPRYRMVYVALKQAIGSASPKYRPWVPGSTVILADDAYVCLTDADSFVPKVSPVRAFAADELVAAADIARSAGVRRLVVVAPLSALLQLNAASHAISSEQEMALVDMRFETLVIVHPTRSERAAAAGGWIARTVQSLARSVMEIMLPSPVQPLHPRTAALAILAAVERLPPGVHVIGARELSAIVAQTMPALAARGPKLR